MMSQGPARWLPGWIARVNAWRRQARGRYDDETAAWFRHAWRRSGKLTGLVEWLQFRRELGFPVDPRAAARLCDALADARGPLARQVAELLLEVQALTGAARRDELAWLAGHADVSPPIAALMRDIGTDLSQQAARLADLYAQQDMWRAEFCDRLARCDGSVCVVGNAASLVGSGLGPVIDRQAMVVRFNRWRSGSASEDDLGSRLDVWVCTPRFLPQLARMGGVLPTWLVLSGPDVRYQRAGRGVDWDLVVALLDQGVKVLTVPLTVWRGVVEPLGAPPSAGVLMLAWARRCIVDVGRLSFVGFGSTGSGGAYHHASARMRPGRRHAWVAEAALLRAWQHDGMRALTFGNGAD